MKRKKNIRSLRRKKSSRRRRVVTLAHVDWEKIAHIFGPDKKIILQRLAKENNQFLSTKDLLKLLAAGMIIGLTVAFPTAPLALAPLFIDRRKFQGYRFNQTVKRLKKQKMVEFVMQEGRMVLKITEAGRVRALSYKIDDIRIEKPKKWDKKWRMVVFDIPEKEKVLRDAFRTKLKEMGFFQFQESVWVHPYPCLDQVEFIRELLYVSVNARYVVAQRIEDDEDLRKHFELD